MHYVRRQGGHDVYAGDWILSLLGTTMWVGGLVALGGAGAIMLAVLRVALGAGGLAGARTIPPFGVSSHAEEVRGRLRARYLARAVRAGVPFTLEAADLSATVRAAASANRPHPARIADPISVLVAERAAIAITRLPPLNESLSRGLSSRVTARASASPRRDRRRQRKRTRKVAAA